MSKINFRQRAKRHVETAKMLLDLTENRILPAACLELRLAIECIAYELLQTYDDEVSQGIMATWQPAKIIRELCAIDSTAGLDRTISYAAENTSGFSDCRCTGSHIRLLNAPDAR